MTGGAAYSQERGLALTHPIRPRAKSFNDNVIKATGPKIKCADMGTETFRPFLSN